MEENIDETLTFYGLPLSHHKHLKSTNLLERLNEELKRRTLVVRIFPNAASCLRLSRALAVEMHENFHEQGARCQQKKIDIPILPFPLGRKEFRIVGRVRQGRENRAEGKP